MGKAIGGYVRRCERDSARFVGDPIRAERPRFELFFQSMPILRFEPFDVTEELDHGVSYDVASWYANRQRSKGPYPTSG